MPRELEDVLSEYFPYLRNRIAENHDTHIAVESVRNALNDDSLSWARLNQVMHLCSEAGMSAGFYNYYFLQKPERHPYPVEAVFATNLYEPPEGVNEIKSMMQLEWGIRRFIYDAMLYWGNIRQAYRDLRQLSLEEITEHFANKRLDERRLITRGEIVQPTPIPQDNRYLISEMACKTYEEKESIEEVDHIRIALEAFRDLNSRGVTVTPALLRERASELANNRGQIGLFELLFEEPTEVVESENDVLALYTGQWNAFKSARDAALHNTRIYLSACSDLDVYVATSMRTRADFREMAKTCAKIFNDERLRQYNIRYFDPTLSAAHYHEDKGIIECLMVKTSKILLYFAQHKESLGKVSEFAMALSLGKPVIILCPSDQRGTEIFRFYRDQHPLLRLVAFETGIVNGAIVTQKEEDVIELVNRILLNRMEYNLERKQGHEAYYLLKERLTHSTVRVITDDKLLKETFWNNYHGIY